MADKTYVEVANIKVTDAFDKKYKTSLPAKIGAAVEKIINNSANYTTKQPSDKTATGFYIDGNVISIDKTDKGNTSDLDVKVSMQIADWPKKAMFGFLKGGAKVPGASAKTMDADVAEGVTDIFEDLLKKKAFPAMDARAKAKP